MIEHAMDLGVARQMSRQAMRWSPEGPNNPLAMEPLRFAPVAWRAW